MNNEGKPVALVLGGIFPHAELLRKLKKRGYYTILVDYFENPPAAAAADMHSRESAMDYEAVLKLAKEYDAKLVMSSCLDQQIVIAMQVSEALGIPHPFSAETALKVTNKRYMKQIMTSSGIPTARYYEVDEQSDLSKVNIDYPVIVKPVDSCGAAGVSKIEDPSELSNAVKRACHWSRTNDAIVEEFKKGMEVSVYTFIKDKKAHVVTTSQRISVIDKEQAKCFCAVSPAPISEEIRDKMEKIATSLAEAFDLDNTPLFYQSIVKGDDVFVIEFSPRMGGGLCYRTMQLNAKFEMLDASINSYLGLDTEVDAVREDTYYLIHQVHGFDGTFDHLEGYEELIKEGILKEIFPMKTKGMEISNEKSSSSRTAMLLIEGRDSDEFLRKLDEAMPRLEIRDPEGKPLMDRSLHLTKKILEDNINAASEI
ncbi:MAG: ATP-grasp domain-containing protein [Eubacterium sp.]|nr:ATP-grasp domain-containing protein [Eubacterium sp.]SEG19131.1 Phosphoribosylamine-glycine ligase [Eubacterium ruminantium]